MGRLIIVFTVLAGIFIATTGQIGSGFKGRTGLQKAADSDSGVAVTGDLAVSGELNVTGNIRTAGTVSVTGSVTSALAADTLKHNTVTRDLTLKTTAGNKNILLLPNGSGNVGIGETNPTSKLYVNGAAYVSTSVTANTLVPITAFYSYADTYNLTYRGGGNGTTGHFFYPRGGSTPLVVMRADNFRTGVGTTSPSAKLEVSGKKTTDPLFAASNDYDGTFGDSTGIYIDATGKLAVGSSNPSGYRIHSTGGIYSSTNVTAVNSTLGEGYTGGNAATGFWVRNNQNTNPAVIFALTSSVTEQARITTTGLGLGTTAPTAKLQVTSSSSTIPLRIDHGNFAADGDARMSVFVLRDTTQSSQSDTLHLDGLETGTNFISIDANSAKYFEGEVIGWAVSGTDDNKSVCYKIEGLIQRDGSNNTTLPWSSVTDKYEHADLAGAAVTLSANDTSERLNIIVTGEGANTIRWVAVVRMCHVGG